MRVTSVQLDIGNRPKFDNVSRAVALVEQSPASDLILLPEIWPCGYFSFARYRQESEPIDGPTIRAFQRIARKRRCHLLMGSFVENDADRLFNTTLLLDPEGEIAARYRKIHLFGYQSEERDILTPGTEVVVVDAPWGMSGFSTCYDLRFPELYRRMVDRGASFYLIPSAWPRARLDAWRLFNRARALENLCFLISCNSAGTNGGHRFAGHSMVVNPLGEVVAEAGENEEILTADLDPAMVARTRREFSALEDRVLSC